MTSERDDPEARLARLEAQVRGQRRLLLGLTALAAAMFLTGAVDDGRLEVKALHITDSENRPRITLGMLPDETPGILLLDPWGQPRGGLTMTPAGEPAVVLMDVRRETRAMLTLGPRGEPSLVFRDPWRVDRTLLGTDRFGDPLMMLYDRAGKGRLALSCRYEGPFVSLLGWDEKRRLELAVKDPEGAPELGFFDAEGRPLTMP